MLHLLHPPLVHFTVALLVLGGSLEAWGLLARRDGPLRLGAALVLLGSATVPLTMFTGYIAANTVHVPERAARTLALHELDAWLIAATFGGALFWKGWYGGRVPERHRVPYAALLALGVLLVVWAAFLGGELVYVNGVGVGARSG